MSHHHDLCLYCDRNHLTINQGQDCMKKHTYKTAYVIGLNRCCVGLLEYNARSEMYRCLMPFGNERWIPESELKDFNF
jgi:hypothetical protein